MPEDQSLLEFIPPYCDVCRHVLVETGPPLFWSCPRCGPLPRPHIDTRRAPRARLLWEV